MTLPETLRALSLKQKLAIVTELWNDLAASAPMRLPAEQLREMQRRRDELLADPTLALDRSELWRRIDGS